MTFDQNQLQYVAAQLLGNVDVPRNVNPILRTRKRRLDPDLTSSVPYYSGASGKTLSLSYTKEVSSVVTTATVTILFAGDSLTTIIANINAADSSNIQALDLDGFLAIKNLNPGKTHKITVVAFSPSASDAAPVLGFATSPAPGSTSFAGEIASSPGNRTQLNPHPTALLAKDNSLSSAEINRGFAALLQVIENLRAELAREVIVYKDIPLTFANHPISTANRVARINQDSIRLFCPRPSGGGLTTDLEPYFRVLDTSHNDSINTTLYTAVKIIQIYYATTATALSATAFSTWGTPNGGSVLSTTVQDKDKHAATAISSIVGNIVTCSSATFVTKKIGVGDFVELTASVLQPFDHSGWYVVDGILNETQLAVRPMSFGSTGGEQPIEAGENRPRCLNPLGGGTLRVTVGTFIPAGDLWLEVNDTSATSLIIRAPVGTPFRELQVTDQRNFSGNLGVLSDLLLQHLNDTTAAHAASSIGGFTSATAWRDATTITGANLKSTIEDILTDLAAQSATNSGSGRIGAEAISIGGSTPNSLAQGTLLSQLTALLTALQTHVAQSSGAHAASSISYAGGGNWADGTTNPATTVEAQLDKVITDLGGSGGAAKIGFGGSGTWADGTTNPATTIESQLDKIVTDLGGTGGASKIKYDGGAAWADTTANPATTVESQLDKIITDLAASTGSAKIGGAASGTDIAAATLATQIANLAVNWLKMSRANTISAAQTFSSLITANGGLTAGINQDITVSGTGAYKHGLRTLPISGVSAVALVGSVTFTNNIANFSGSGTSIMIPILLPSGKTISAVRVFVNDNSSGTTKVTASFHSLTITTGGEATLATSSASSGAGATQTLPFTGLSSVISAGHTYFIVVTITSGSALCQALGCDVDYSE